MIRLDGFSYCYRDSGEYALREIDLEISAGEFVLLTGPSGCGKTTLALALAGFLFSQYDGEFDGEIAVGGIDPAREPIYRTADVVGLVQQNPENQFCTLTVEDEIAFGLENRRMPPEEIEGQLSWSLEAVGAAQLRERSLGTLSGGEKQKIALAAILAARPRVIIFDEPTSNLDPQATREIFEIILDLQRRTDLTVLVIEHKLDFLQQAGPRLICMEEGRLLSEQPPQPSAIQLRPPAPGDPRSAPLLEISALSVSYPGKQVLQNLDLTLFPGELVSLLGDNGSGKSTLLLTLLRFVERESGQIRFLGRDLEAYDPRRLGREIGLVFQNPDHQIFASSVWEEAVLGARNFGLNLEDVEDQTRVMLERAGLGSRLDDHPYRLSYGEKRRLNLISVLSYQPGLLLLDEIFIGQDPRNAEFLLQLLVPYVEAGNCVVMVNHNPAYYPLVSTRLLFLQEGRFIVDSPLQEGLERLKEIGAGVYLPGGRR